MFTHAARVAPEEAEFSTRPAVVPFMWSDLEREVDDFKWGETPAVIPRVDAVAVYENTDGDIVIRQQNQMGDDDEIIVIPRKYAATVCYAVMELVNDERPRTESEPVVSCNPLRPGE